MFFIQNQYRYFMQKNIQAVQYTLENFDNKEYLLNIFNTVLAQKCVIIGSLTAPDSECIELLLLIHTLKQSKAEKIILWSPYLGYQRQENIMMNKSTGLLWADTMLKAAGVDLVITVDAHNEKSLLSLQVPVRSYSMKSVFFEEINYFVYRGFSFVFPDAGSVDRYAWLTESFPMVEYAFFFKKRIFNQILFDSFHGTIQQRVIIFDDILDSGKTLVQTCLLLRNMGVQEIVIFVSHAFFSGHVWKDLWGIGVTVLYCTDSVPAVQSISSMPVSVKSISFLLQKSI